MQAPHHAQHSRQPTYVHGLPNALLQAKLARVFEVCEQQWEVYDPLCEEYDLLLACLHCWQARARHKKGKRHQTQQHNCADAFRYDLHTLY